MTENDSDLVLRSAASAIRDGRPCFVVTCTFPNVQCPCMRDAIHAINTYLNERYHLSLIKERERATKSETREG